MNHSSHIALALGIVFIAAIIAIAFYCPLVNRNYTLKYSSLTAPIKIVHVSDLHSALYGEGQKNLLDRINKYSPDLILLTGDIADASGKTENVLMFLRGITSYPTFYVIGNHEIPLVKKTSYLEDISSLGVVVLKDEVTEIEVNGQKINIVGLDDIKQNKEKENFTKKISSLAEECVDNFTILLSHRPEYSEEYRSISSDGKKFNLILSGHAHGGQWRLPGILNGLYAPQQGLFPKYAGGIYGDREVFHIVSRGLGNRTGVPRIFNPYELVFINCLPDE